MLKLARIGLLRTRVPGITLTRTAVAFTPSQLPIRAFARPFSHSLPSFSAAATARARVEVEEEDVEVPLRKTFKSVESSLHAPIYRAVTDRPFRYETMSDVQAAVLALLPRLSCSPSPTPLATTSNDDPEALQQAQDILVRAKTGTGKTLAFLIPALEGRLRALESFLATYKLENPSATNKEANKAWARFAKNSVGAVIISPTRELATQIAKEARALVTHLPNFGVRLLVGGESKMMQLREWSRADSNDIVVATPGRICDVLESEKMVRDPIAFSRMLILDEADTLLDMGFSDAIKTINDHMPSIAERQTFLFSATVSKQIREVARQSMKKDHVFIDTVGKDEVDTHLHIPQYHTVLDTPDDQITHILRLIAHDQLLHARHAAENGGVGGGKAVIFLPTTRLTQLFSLILQAAKSHLPWGRDTNIIEIHSKKDQKQRSRASDLFRSNKTGYSILVTSDVSARGVDYPGVTRVIQVGIPGSRDLYIHRVGRTGRAGKDGRGDIILLPWEKAFLSKELNDIPFSPYSVDQCEKDLATLSAEWDANPIKTNASLAPVLTSTPFSRGKFQDRRQRSSPLPVRSITSPVSPRLETLSESLTTNILPNLDEIDVRETFASLLGYYIPKNNELRVDKEDVVQGLKEWGVRAMGLEQEPYVSAAFLSKLGMSSSSRRGGSSRYGGGGGGGGRDRPAWGSSSRGEDRPSRGVYESRNGDRRESRGGYESRGGDRRSGDKYESRGGDRRGGDRYESRPSRYEDDGPARERKPRKSAAASFGYGGSSLFDSADADAWEKPARRGRA